MSIPDGPGAARDVKHRSEGGEGGRDNPSTSLPPTRRPLLLVGDLTYAADNLEPRRVPGVGNRRRLLEATNKVLPLKKAIPGLVVLPAHDPTAARRLLQS